MKNYIEIEEVHAREVLDSRGKPTVEVEITTEDGNVGRAIVPSGASTGKAEALELRDGDKNRYNGNGVIKAVKNVNEVIRNRILYENALEPRNIDEIMLELDGTENKSILGANAMLGVSMAVLNAGAKCLGIPLYKYIGGTSARKIPCPMMNILNGGKHADNNVNIQEFMIVPVDIAEYPEKIRACSEIYYALKSILKEEKLLSGVGDEGGFAPNLRDDEMALEFLNNAIIKAGYKGQVKISLDVAASEMFNESDGNYSFWKTGEIKDVDGMITFYEKIVSKYPIFSIEDGLAEDDWNGWKKLTNTLGEKIYLVGDDLFVTNVERLSKGINEDVANSILIKPNQIGTVTETIQAICMAKENGYMPIVSHRSGETEDTFIADLSVALNISFIKTGAPTRGERTAKYNELLRIYDELEMKNEL